MPTNRKRLRRGARPPISEALYQFFATGEYDFAAEGALDVFVLQGDGTIRQEWQAVRDTFLARWQKENPETLPWAALEWDNIVQLKRGEE